MMARRVACGRVSAASVATTTSVVLARIVPLVRGSSAPGGMGEGKPRPPNSLPCSNGAAQNHGPSSTTTLPTALTAASAPIVKPPWRAEAEPVPPLEVARAGAEPAAGAAERDLAIGRGRRGRVAELAIGRVAAPVLVAAV